LLQRCDFYLLTFQRFHALGALKWRALFGMDDKRAHASMVKSSWTSVFGGSFLKVKHPVCDLTPARRAQRLRAPSIPKRASQGMSRAYRQPLSTRSQRFRHELQPRRDYTEQPDVVRRPSFPVCMATPPAIGPVAIKTTVKQPNTAKQSSLAPFIGLGSTLFYLMTGCGWLSDRG
jgi:hypothetical protein